MGEIRATLLISLFLSYILQVMCGDVFIETKRASQVLARARRANSMFEEMKPGDLERECLEEICDHEEASEVFDQPQETPQFWWKYKGCNGLTLSRNETSIRTLRSCLENETGKCSVGNGETYRESVSITSSGKECQYWSSNFPHRITEFKTFLDKSLQENYCRNPDGSDGPWCFTRDPSVRRESCAIPQCEGPFVPAPLPTKVEYTYQSSEPSNTTNCIPDRGRNYRGNLSVTINGFACLPWASPEVVNMAARIDLLLDASLEANYCRNPDNDTEGPWCFVGDPGVTMDYCDMELCDDPLIDDDSNSMEKRQQIKKAFFNPQTFGAGELVCGERPLFEKVGKADSKEDEIFGAPRGWSILKEEAEVGSAPWQAILQKRHTLEVLCGASLISNQWLLTAAHCVIYPPWNKSFNSDDILARFGKHFPSQFERVTEKIVALDKIIVHPKYNWRKNLRHDIALLHLKKNLTFTTHIHPICLPTRKVAKDLMQSGFMGRVTGWGNLFATWSSTPKAQPTVLQQAHLSVVDQHTCRTSIPITDSMFCAEPSLKESKKYTCEGDSGGPFVMKNPMDNRWYQIGIVSWGEGCDQVGKYGFYSHVFRTRNWIKKVTEDVSE